MSPSTISIAAVVYPGAQILDVTGPLETFSSANRLAFQLGLGSGVEPYRVSLFGETPGPVKVSGGIELVAKRAWGRQRSDIDTLIIPGASDPSVLFRDDFLDWLRAMSSRVRRLVSVCSGAFLLAEAGLLDGRRATTHWESCDRLRAQYPQVDVNEDALFIKQGSVYTSAGITAGIDLALALIEEDFGKRLAMATARELVVFYKRPGGQSQFSDFLLAQTETGDELQELVDWILSHLDHDLSVESLATRAGLSARHLSRLFREQVSMTPARFVELARIERARHALENSKLSLKQIAAKCGFGSVERMRRTFERRLSIKPSDYRHFHSSHSLSRSHHGR